LVKFGLKIGTSTGFFVRIRIRECDRVGFSVVLEDSKAFVKVVCQSNYHFIGVSLDYFVFIKSLSVNIYAGAFIVSAKTTDAIHVKVHVDDGLIIGELHDLVNNVALIIVSGG